MPRPTPVRTHLVTGGYPAGSTAGHDMDYARRQLLGILGEHSHVLTSSAGDFDDLGKWLPGSQFLVTYVAGPYLDAERNALVADWLARGGRWLALHGTSGGRAVRVGDGGRRQMVKSAHHTTLGAFFLNHPPLARFRVDVHGGSPLTAGLPASFDVVDELYLIEVQGACDVLLTTQLARDPSPPGFGFVYDADTSVGADGVTRVLGYQRTHGLGSVVYVALGHCHGPASNMQPLVDASASADGRSPATFPGSWEHSAFRTLLANAVRWGIGGTVAAAAA